MNLIPRHDNGVLVYLSDSTDKISVVACDDRYYIRMSIDGKWEYPYWDGVQDGFGSLLDAQEWISNKDVNTATLDSIQPSQMYKRSSDLYLDELMDVLGFHGESNGEYILSSNTISGKPVEIKIKNNSGKISTEYSIDGILMHTRFPKDTTNVNRVVRNIERILSSDIDSTYKKKSILAGISTKNLAKNLIRVRSSNVWAYVVNIKNKSDPTGDLMVQFKAKNGGPGDIYIYYDVPSKICRRMHTTTSKGHFLWTYIRGKYAYSKLTGDKRGKMRGAVNNKI